MGSSSCLVCIVVIPYFVGVPDGKCNGKFSTKNSAILKTSHIRNGLNDFHKVNQFSALLTPKQNGIGK